MAGPWFCSQRRSRPTCPFVWRVQPAWAPKMSPSHPEVRHRRLLCGLCRCCLCTRWAIHLCPLRFLLRTPNPPSLVGLTPAAPVSGSVVTCQNRDNCGILFTIWGCKHHCGLCRVWKIHPLWFTWKLSGLNKEKKKKKRQGLLILPEAGWNYQELDFFFCFELFSFLGKFICKNQTDSV